MDIENKDLFREKEMYIYWEKLTKMTGITVSDFKLNIEERTYEEF